MSKTLGTAIDEVINALKDLDEASRPIAIKAACDHLNIHLSSTYRSMDKDRDEISDNEKTSQETSPKKKISITDIRTLKDNKSPANGQEMACLVALYLSEYAPDGDKKEEIETEDIEKYFKQAGFPLPKVPGQVLRDAKAAGYFDSPSKGTFKLNPVGYNLAVHGLPRKIKK